MRILRRCTHEQPQPDAGARDVARLQGGVAHRERRGSEDDDRRPQPLGPQVADRLAEPAPRHEADARARLLQNDAAAHRKGHRPQQPEAELRARRRAGGDRAQPRRPPPSRGRRRPPRAAAGRRTAEGDPSPMSTTLPLDADGRVRRRLRQRRERRQPRCFGRREEQHAAQLDAVVRARVARRNKVSPSVLIRNVVAVAPEPRLRRSGSCGEASGLRLGLKCRSDCLESVLRIVAARIEARELQPASRPVLRSCLAGDCEIAAVNGHRPRNAGRRRGARGVAQR